MKQVYKKMDKPLLLLTAIFTIFGLIMIFSASSISAVLYNKVAEYYFFKKQLLIAVVMWLFGLLIIVRVPTSKYKYLSKVYFYSIIGLLVAILSYGTIVNSAKSWINIGPIRIQPSEFLKPALIIYLGVYFEKIINKKDYNMTKLFYPFIMCLLGFGLVVLQPDLGTAIIIAGITGLIFLYLPIKTKEFKIAKISSIIFVLLVGIFVILSGNFLTSEQADRLKFNAPCTRYTEKTGYQVCNGFIAISNGGLFGTGLGNSTQKYLYLPEAHTDFIFPIIVEELGAVGGIIVILMFIYLLFRLLKLARCASTTRGKIIAYGTFAYIIIHLAVNFLGILALIPLTGVPVPFLSYGGSFLMNVLFLMFVNQRIAIETNNAREKAMLRRI